MKNSNSMLILIFSTIFSLSLLACGNGKTNKDEAETNVQDHGKMEQLVENNMPEGSTMQMSEGQSVPSLIDHYLEIKNALVQDDAEGASRAGQKLVQSTSDFDLNSVDESRQTEINELLEAIKEHGEEISRNEIDNQRKHFEEMAKDFADLLEITGTERTLYQQYCPMYNNNKGGYWLSESKTIKNPLFGSKMLTCGKVTKIIE